MALVGSVSSNVEAQTTLPSFPTVAQPAIEADSGLLPYPFSKQPSASDTESLQRQLVQLIGLASHSKAIAPACAMPSVCSQPLPAADEGLPLMACEVPAIPVGPLPALAQPVPPATSPVIPASATETDDSDLSVAVAESESLIDIEVPLTLTADSSPVEPDAPQPDVESAIATSPTFLEPEATVTHAIPVMEAREPAIVNSLHRLSLTASPATASTAATSVEASLSDATPAGATSTGTSIGATHNKFSDSAAHSDSTVQFSMRDEAEAVSQERPASLHLSSASNAALKTSSSRPQQGMQIRIEGEPAPLLEPLSVANAQQDATAPLPTFDGQSRSSMSTSSLLPSGLGMRKSIKASFASRTTPVEPQHPEPEPEAPRSQNMRLGDAMSVGIQDSTMVSTAQTIVEMSVEHPHICQLLKTSDTTASLIGMRPGSTRIALICQDSSGERTVEVREVSISGNTEVKTSLPQLAKEISRTVAKLYPNSDVQVTAHNESLIVRGFTNYESDAKKILALVRKTSLTPVVDQLMTNGN